MVRKSLGLTMCENLWMKMVNLRMSFTVDSMKEWSEITRRPDQQQDLSLRTTSCQETSRKFFNLKLLFVFKNKQPEKENACAVEQGCQTSLNSMILSRHYYKLSFFWKLNLFYFIGIRENISCQPKLQHDVLLKFWSNFRPLSILPNFDRKRRRLGTSRFHRRQKVFLP